MHIGVEAFSEVQTQVLPYTYYKMVVMGGDHSISIMDMFILQYLLDGMQYC